MLQSFKSYSNNEYLSEGILGKLLKTIVSLFIKGIMKISRVKFGLFGSEQLKDGRRGIRYIVGPDGKIIRFNYKGNSLESIDLWYNDNNNWLQPDINFNLEKFKDVLSLVPVFGAILTSPRKFNQSFEINESTIKDDTQYLIEYRTKGAKNKKTLQKLKNNTQSGNAIDSYDIEADSAQQKYGNIEELAYSDPDTIFDDLKFAVNAVLDGTQNSLLITGTGGIGKTQTTTNVLDKRGYRKGTHYIVSKGTASPYGLYRILVDNSDKLIIFDDCDDVLKDSTAKNILKSALDTKEEREISWNSARTFNPDDFDDDEITDMIEDGKLPSKTIFRGQIIFISNLMPNKIDQAVKSRCMVVDINLKQDDVIKLIRNLKDEIKFPGLDIKDNHKEEALQLMENNINTMKEITIRGYVLIAKALVSADQAGVDAAQKTRILRMCTGGML